MSTDQEITNLSVSKSYSSRESRYEILIEYMIPANGCYVFHQSWIVTNLHLISDGVASDSSWSGFGISATSSPISIKVDGKKLSIVDDKEHHFVGAPNILHEFIKDLMNFAR